MKAIQRVLPWAVGAWMCVSIFVVTFGGPNVYFEKGILGALKNFFILKSVPIVGSKGWDSHLQEMIWQEQKQCSAVVKDVVVDREPGMSLTAVMPLSATLFHISPHGLISFYGKDEPFLASYHAWSQGSWNPWYRRAAQSVKRLPESVLSHAANSDKIHLQKFGRQAQDSRFQDAVLELAMRGQTKKTKNEPWPGVLVLQDARFTAADAYAWDCRFAVSAGCYDSFAGQTAPTGQECSRQDKSLKYYDKVVSIVVRRAEFDHLMMVGLTRLVLVYDLLRADPLIQIAGFCGGGALGVKFWCSGVILEILKLENKLIHDPHGGCAKRLILPEPVGCSEPSLGMIHLTRAALRFHLRPPEPPARKTILVVQNWFGTPQMSVIENHDEIVQEFKKVFGDTHAVSEWSTLHHAGYSGSLLAFRDIDAVFGPDCPDFLNVFIMKPNTGVVVTMLPHGKKMTGFKHMNIAFQLELNYRALIPKLNPETHQWRVYKQEAVDAMTEILS